MCGICGVTYFDQNYKVLPEMVERMCDVIVHRGPDDSGLYVHRNTGLGMRRLSIIDLVTGHQPIANEDQSIWIVFNGEIYNHLELRKELETRGHKFKTRTDTEAILHAYEEYGVDCPQKLNGMFAFAIFDQKKQSLFLARDRLGIKPLYYYQDNEKLAFGSELKSILELPNIPRQVNSVALDIYMTFEYIPAPHSIFKNIYKLPPGHFLLLKDGKIKIKSYWELHFDERPWEENQLCEELIDLLQDAVKIRLMSDVPLGAFLSGGIDSSTVVALMSRVMDRPVETFSIAFKESSYNEAHYARTIASTFHTNHHEFTIEPDALELTQKLVGHLDEPLGDFSIFPTYLVSKMAREYVTVALSGDGGDELFGGYETYIADKIAKMYMRIPKFLRDNIIVYLLNKIPPTEKKKGLINRAKRFVEGMQLPSQLEHTRWMIFLQEVEKIKLYTHDFQNQLKGLEAYNFILNYFDQTNNADAINRQLFVDIKTYLVDDILVKVDRMSMATSLEARVPFLDHRFVEFTTQIPGEYKLKGRRTKFILKKALHSILPDEILKRGKEGFSIPIKNWLKTDLKDLMLDVLSPDNIKNTGFFEPAYVQKLIREHLTGVENHSHRLWAMIVFSIWHEIYLKGKTRSYGKTTKTSYQLSTF
ncbi:MAG: asparagine synthase (glutamine-hydrolyzing) [Calditrichaeota bacterium]|nr:MAG: asparagine synthase (glutamine-hydrolyzing) [Calditrichota bacterium]